MKKGRVILLIYHGQGHFHACLRIARILSRDYDIYFSGHIYFEKYITLQGFKFYPLQTVPFGLGFEKWVNQQEGKKNIWWQSIKDRWSDRLYHQRKASLEKMLDDISPSHILIDSWQSTDFIVLYEQLKTREIKTAFIQTMLSTVIGSQPPLTSDLLPGEKYSPGKQLRNFLLSKSSKRIINWLRCFGRDNATMITLRIHKNKIPKNYLSQHHAIFTRTFNNIPEFILAPMEFEFTGFVPLPHQHYIGSMFDTERQEFTSQEFDAAFRNILSKIDKRPLVYCTLGSTDHEDANSVISFIEKLATAIEAENLSCIISSGGKKVLEYFRSKKTNVHVFHNVPQLTVLQHASILVTHAGLNTIKEAIHFEIPMLAFPLRKETDNPGNAARIKYYGLGLQGNLKSESTESIRQKIDKLLNDSSYREHLRLFRLRTNHYSDEHFLQLFESIEKTQ